MREYIRTIIDVADQTNLERFLKSESGRKVIAFLYEQAVYSAPPNASPEMFAHQLGKSAGFADCIAFLKRMATEDNQELNSVLFEQKG